MDGHTAAHIHSLFNPDDEQDVKLAFDLLKDIWSLPPLTEHRNPSVLEARISLRTLGKLLYHMVFPYLCVDLSLSEQLEHLSAAAHLAFALFHSSNKSFIPTLLYVDLMIMIKNVYFCVAKARAENPDGTFSIGLLGTDRLEELFGILRTMIGNDTNLDIWQLTSRLTGTTQVSNILAKYPQWDRAPRHLKLPAITRDSRELPSTSDHIKPSSWRGNVHVRSVTLQTAWNRGRRLVEEEYSFMRSLFISLETKSNITILTPFGKLLVGSALLDEEDESQELIRPRVTLQDTTIQPVQPTSRMSTNSIIQGPLPPPQHSPSTPSSARLLEDGLGEPISSRIIGEAHAEIEDALLASDAPALDAPVEETPKSVGVSNHERFIIYQGKKVLKSRAISLRSRLTGRTAPSLTDRLKRVQEVERYRKGSPLEDRVGSFADSDTSNEQIVIQDPVGTLVRCDGHIFLCIGEVNNIKIDSRSVASVSLQDVAEADDATKITISLSLLGLRRTTHDNLQSGPLLRMAISESF